MISRFDKKKLDSFVKKLEKLVLKFGKTTILDEISKVLDINTHNHIYDIKNGKHNHDCCLSDDEIIQQKHREYNHNKE